MNVVRVLQSIGAVVAGFLAVVLLSVGTDFLLESTGVLPPQDRIEDYTNTHYALAASYRTLFNVVGGYIAAWLAPRAKVLHGIILGAIGLCAALAGVVVAWNLIPPETRWYPIALVVTSLPFCWLGAKFYRPRMAI